MNKEDFQNLILSTEVGKDIRISMTKEDAKKMRVHIIRAEKYGYKICCVLLYANIYYLEKLQEGDKEKYESTRKHWGCEKTIKKKKVEIKNIIKKRQIIAYNSLALMCIWLFL